jgi:hypothetical protein
MTRLDQLLFGLICFLCDNGKKECIVSNADLACDLNVKPVAVQRKVDR